MVPPADVNKCKQNSFFLPDWKPPSHSRTRAGPCSSAGSGSFQGWASSTGAWCLQPSGAQIWGLSALASQLIPASGFKPKAKGSSLRKVLGHSIFAEWLFSWFHWETKWNLLVKLCVTLSKQFGKIIVLVGLDFVFQFKRIWVASAVLYW